MPAENIRTVVTDSLVGMISAVTSMTPPAGEPLPDFIQSPIDRAVVERISAAVVPTPLGVCGQVAVMPGWENSKGARLEVLIAERLGMTVVNAHDLVLRQCKSA